MSFLPAETEYHDRIQLKKSEAVRTGFLVRPWPNFIWLPTEVNHKRFHNKKQAVSYSTTLEKSHQILQPGMLFTLQTLWTHRPNLYLVHLKQEQRPQAYLAMRCHLISQRRGCRALNSLNLSIRTLTPHSLTKPQVKNRLSSLPLRTGMGAHPQQLQPQEALGCTGRGC